MVGARALSALCEALDCQPGELFSYDQGWGEFETGCRSPVANRSRRNGFRRREPSPAMAFATSRPTPSICSLVGIEDAVGVRAHVVEDREVVDRERARATRARALVSGRL